MSKRKEYTIISLVGRTNTGKSSLLNLLSGQRDFALTDPQPGTTADTVITSMEIHDFGPVKIFDTAGVDENTPLGEKKRKKTFAAIEESDLTLVVIDLLKRAEDHDFVLEKEIIARAREYNKQVLLIYNIFSNDLTQGKINTLVARVKSGLNVDLPSFTVNALDFGEQEDLVNFISQHYKKESRNADLIPLPKGSGYVILNIPMDEETPDLRLLRPQDMAMERLLRKYLIPVLFRMDLKKARASDESEKERFRELIEYLRRSKEGLKLIITDSQAMDVLSQWVPEEIPLTTFSVMMTNYMSYGNLGLFVRGLEAFATLERGDKILIIEACNHDRKCDDIGTRQIPRLIKKKLGLELQIDFSFGRTLPEDLEEYRLAIHCGGCMIDRQKYSRRILKLQKAGVPVTNYGLFLSWINDARALKRVVEIFNH